MFAATLLMFIAAATILLLTMIAVIYSIQDVLILTDNQLLENKFYKFNHQVGIVDIIQSICSAVIVC